jgi:rod shape-determining protein MreB
VTGDVREVMVELSVEGKKQVVDIGDLILESCKRIIPLVGSAIKKIVATADPEYQPILRNNIILSGGGSGIEGIADVMADEISDIGDVTVTCVEDPIERVAAGALVLAQDMPDEQYTSIV